MLGTYTYICICNLTIYMKKDCPRQLFNNREISELLLLVMINARAFERNRFQKDHKDHGMLSTRCNTVFIFSEIKLQFIAIRFCFYG